MSVSERIEEPTRADERSSAVGTHPPVHPERRSPLIKVWFRHLGLWLSVGWLAVEIIAAIFADFLPLAEGRNPSLTLDAPILQPLRSSPGIRSAPTVKDWTS